MLRIATCVFIAMATVCVSDLARAKDDFSRSGWYLGLAGTVAFPISAEDAVEDATSSSADVSESLGLHARAGYRGNWLGGEVHFEWLENFDVKADRLDFKVDGWALTLDGKLYPLGLLESKLTALARRFHPFATAGIGYVRFSGPQGIDDDPVIRLGGGLDVYVTRNIAISVDTTYVLPMSLAIDDLDYVSVGWGVLYRF
jgi:opacity protein-like surface antigen